MVNKLLTKLGLMTDILNCNSICILSSNSDNEIRINVEYWDIRDGYCELSVLSDKDDTSLTVTVDFSAGNGKELEILTFPISYEYGKLKNGYPMRKIATSLRKELKNTIQNQRKEGLY